MTPFEGRYDAVVGQMSPDDIWRQALAEAEAQLGSVRWTPFNAPVQTTTGSTAPAPVMPVGGSDFFVEPQMNVPEMTPQEYGGLFISDTYPETVRREQQAGRMGFAGFAPITDEEIARTARLKAGLPLNETAGRPRFSAHDTGQGTTTIVDTMTGKAEHTMNPLFAPKPPPIKLAKLGNGDVVVLDARGQQLSKLASPAPGLKPGQMNKIDEVQAKALEARKTDLLEKAYTTDLGSMNAEPLLKEIRSAQDELDKIYDRYRTTGATTNVVGAVNFTPTPGSSTNGVRRRIYIGNGQFSQ